MEKPFSGWVGVQSQRNLRYRPLQHYFHAGSSLCGLYQADAPYLMPEDTPHQCGTCRNSLQRMEDRAAAGVIKRGRPFIKEVVS